MTRALFGSFESFVASFGASWFETRENALLTMRVLRPHPEEHRKAMRLEGWMQPLALR
jgi:hypothetical protein